MTHFCIICSQIHITTVLLPRTRTAIHPQNHLYHAKFVEIRHPVIITEWPVVRDVRYVSDSLSLSLSLSQKKKKFELFSIWGIDWNCIELNLGSTTHLCNSGECCECVQCWQWTEWSVSCLCCALLCVVCHLTVFGTLLSVCVAFRLLIHCLNVFVWVYQMFCLLYCVQY